MKVVKRVKNSQEVSTVRDTAKKTPHYPNMVRGKQAQEEIHTMLMTVYQHGGLDEKAFVRPILDRFSLDGMITPKQLSHVTTRYYAITKPKAS